jgi:hypothetical protein
MASDAANAGSASEGKCGEGKCGMRRMDTDGEGKCGGAKIIFAQRSQPPVDSGDFPGRGVPLPDAGGVTVPVGHRPGLEVLDPGFAGT